jgi:hypothetical protein
MEEREGGEIFGEGEQRRLSDRFTVTPHIRLIY